MDALGEPNHPPPSLKSKTRTHLVDVLAARPRAAAVGDENVILGDGPRRLARRAVVLERGGGGGDGKGRVSQAVA